MHEKSQSSALRNAFRTTQLFLTAIAQMPYRIRKRQDGTYAYCFKLLSLPAILNLIVSVLLGLTFALLVVGYTCTLFDLKQGTHLIEVEHLGKTYNDRAWESVVFTNYWVTLIIFCCWIMQTVTGSLWLLLNLKTFVHYFNYWNRAVQVMDMNITEGAKKFFLKEMVIFIVVAITFTVMFVIIAPVRATCGLLTCLVARFFSDNLPAKKHFVIAQVVGYLIVLYGYIGSRAVIMQFVFFSRMLANGCKVWNTRFQNALDRKTSWKNEAVDSPEKIPRGKRSSYKLLLKDHYLIVQLFKMTDSTFSFILNFYYLLEVLSLVFELLYLWFLLGPSQVTQEKFMNPNFTAIAPRLPYKPAKSSSINDSEETDKAHQLTQVILMLLLLFQTTTSCVTTTFLSNDAYVHAMDGFRILRKRGLMYCSSRTERNFLHTLTVSFARTNPILLTSGNYFGINKTLIVIIIGTICAYVIILIQFSFPPYIVQDKVLFGGGK